MRLKVSVLISSCAVVALLGGCGGDGGGGTAPMEYRVESDVTNLSIGQDSSISVTASVRNVTQDRLLPDAPVQYRSADYSIAIVDEDGEVTGRKGGTTDIMAVFRDDTLRIPVTVRGNPIDPSTFRIEYFVPSSIPAGTTISPDRRTVTLGSGVGFTLTAGQTAEMSVFAEDQVGATDVERVVICIRCSQITGDDETYDPSVERRGIWSSTNPDVATVSNTASSFGRVTARAIGTAQIIFSVPGDDLADTVTVNVTQRRLTGVIIQIADPADPRTALPNAPFALGTAGRVQLLALPRVSSPTGTANDRRVTWSMDSDNATVDALGAVSACTVVDLSRGCGRRAVVGDTVTVRATSVPIPADPTPVSGIIKLVIVPSN